MAVKRRRPRRKQRSQLFVKKGRLQWVNILLVITAMVGMVWYIQQNWAAKSQVTTAPTTTHTAFIKKLVPAAQQLDQQYHVLASITLSQAILESDWGQSTNATENNNLFGVKSASGRLMTTQEYYDGAYHTVKRRFAVYDSWHASLVDHAKKLAYGTTWDSQHYAAVIKATDYQTAAQALQTAGYATDPSYAQKLINIIQKYDLQRYDRK
ncbi:glycoside hydrolase family 73 protein [Lactiplantibacillus sp. DA1]|uniref:glycoside hydrolase family 73 protein n=1 Tax=Lactiplantibacillus sp. DA1 TaxID=3079857 RepID=UPI00292A61B5|nr:glycoside hydrolase family 73 protein [Lactiplantibacillus sp. DA1]MDV0429326.1 glycoside hydrolase family 73 protein [Lactiplantibacillus sp. DA1]